ncbi:MAG: HD-GYP domain-containing protein [Candidatus Dormibacteria bacterium]
MADTSKAPGRSGTQWRSRPLLSFLLRALVFATPVAAGIAAVTWLSGTLRRPTGAPEFAAWWVLLSVVGLAVLVLVERATRRLLPLAALLRLSLLFPDHAPARFAVARRAARPKQVLRQLETLGEAGAGPQLHAAQKVLELSVALSVHDRATRGHSERVQVLTDMITRELNLPEEDRARLRWGALLHDIGKLKVPAKVLNKPAAPDPREWALLRTHPAEGARLVAPLRSWLGPWAGAVGEHHEWFDGSGYPLGRHGSEIAWAARIVSVADVFEVITAPRPYRRPVSVTQAREELVRASGTQLDPKVVRAFLNVSVGELWPVVGVGALLCQLPLVSQLVGYFGRLLPGLSGSTAAAGAAGALLVTGIGHPAEPRLPAPTPASASQPSRPSHGDNLPVKAPPSPGPVTGASALTAAAPSPVPAPRAPQGTPAPTPQGNPAPTLTPAPTPTPTPSDTPSPAPNLVQQLVQPVRQVLTQVGSLLRSLGL